jgi:hypothetical protein
MGAVDARLLFSENQALTATAVSTNKIDLRSLSGTSATNANPRDVGMGTPIYWVIVLDVATDGTTADETYVATLRTDDAAAMGSPTILATITIPRSMPAGTRYHMCVPPGAEQFLDVNYTLGGTTPTVTLTSFLTPSMPQHAIYADAI